MNVWLFSNNTDWEKPVIDHFTKTGKWKKVIWNSENNPDKSFHEGLYMRNIDFPEYKNIPDPIYNNIYPNLYQFIDMYSRNSGVQVRQNQYVSFTVHDYLNLFNLLLNYYHYHLTHNDINLVIFNRAPHNGYDFLCYRMAKELGIKTLLLEQSKEPNRFFYYWENEDYGTFNTAQKLFPIKHISIEPKFEKNLVYMAQKKKTFKQRLINLYQSPESYLIREFINKDKRQESFTRYKRKQQFKKRSQKYFSSSPDFSQNYVYFGLHYQPEKTTSNFGGIFNDQLLALERLSTIIPDDWVIYVKENPKQTYFMRGEYFYQRLSKIPKIVLVSTQTSTYDLLKNCKFASTITGTLAWEAITGGKPALVFGWGNWYKNFPGIITYSSSVKLEDIMGQNFSIDQIENKYNEVYSKTAVGVIYNKFWYNSLVKDYSPKKNIENIIYSLEKILNSTPLN